MAMHLEKVRLKYGVLLAAIGTLYVLVNIIATTTDHAKRPPGPVMIVVPAAEKIREVKTGKTWVSMALCWGEKSSMFDKSGFPYGLAGRLSTQLWETFNVSVIMHIVLCGGEDVDSDTRKMEGLSLSEYSQKLREHGALVKTVRMPVCPVNFSCVLHTQLIRLLAFQNKEVLY